MTQQLSELFAESTYVSIFKNRNSIINGDMRIAQRGTSLSQSSGTQQYLLDRFKTGYDSDAGTLTVSQDSSVPTDQFSNSIKLTNAAGNDTSIAASQGCYIYQRIEGYNLKRFRNEQITLSFWVKSKKIGTYCVGFTNGAATYYSYVAEYSINTADTWEKKTITFTFDAGGTWNYTNGVGMQVFFTLAAGSNYQGIADTWNTDASYVKMATSNQVNWLNETANTFYLNETANTFYLTGVQLELGSDATDFEHDMFGQQLLNCQRYYYKTYNYSDAPGATVNDGSIYNTNLINGYYNYSGRVSLPVAMRTNPTVVGYSPATGSSGYYRQTYPSAGDYTILVFGYENHIMWWPNNYSGSIFYAHAHMTADAEL